ncbi:hypothetical protein OC835_003575 [Tilletia horrida]|nr:hypothetical protein OC835_003575 [Tilletia horrida]
MAGSSQAGGGETGLREALLSLHSALLDAVIPILPPRPPTSAPSTSLAASQYTVARSIVTRLAAPLEDSEAIQPRAGITPGTSPQQRPPAPNQRQATTVALASILPDILRLFSARAAPVRDEEIQKLLVQAMDLERDALNGAQDEAQQPRFVARLANLTRGIQHVAEEMMADIRTHHRKRSDASTASHATSNRPVSPLDPPTGGDASPPTNVSQESLILTAPPGTAADQFRRHVQSDLELTMQRSEIYAVWGGEEAVKTNWLAWVADRSTALQTAEAIPPSESLKWRARLLDAVFCDDPVRLPVLPTRANLKEKEKEASSVVGGNNTIPHALIAGATPLFNLQNRVQAVVVLACLVAVVTSAVGTRGAVPQQGEQASSTSSADSDTWAARLWMLLEDFIAEPDQPQPSVSDQMTATDPAASAASSEASARPAPAEAERTRLRNLTAECIRAYRELRGLSTTAPRSDDTAADEVKIEAGVRGALRYEDPVFKILRKRLYAAMLSALIEPPPNPALHNSSSSSSSTQSPHGSPTPTSPVPLPPTASPKGGAPARLATGRSHPTRATGSRSANATGLTGPKLPPIPGFTRPALVGEKANEVVRETDAVCRAIAKVWSKDLGIE